MKRSVMCVVALLLAAPAFGQTPTPTNAPGLWRRVSFGVAPVSRSMAAGTKTAGRSVQAPVAVERHGFTILVNLGVGIQQDSAFDDSAIGFGGANVGIGAFLNNRIAILGRFSGTNVTYDFYGQQVSGVFGASMQYWVSDLFHFEAGGGLGYWNSGIQSEVGLGLIFGAGVTVFDRGHHNLQVGIEYAPVRTELSFVDNVCITFGYQFHK